MVGYAQVRGNSFCKSSVAAPQHEPEIARERLYCQAFETQPEAQAEICA